MISISAATLALLIEMSQSHIEDIETGLEDGIYEASSNKTLGAKQEALKAAEAAYSDARCSDCDILVEKTLPRVLVVVSGGVADPVFDTGVNVVVFDWDNYRQDPVVTGGVQENFADLASPLNIPVNKAAKLIDCSDVQDGLDVFRSSRSSSPVGEAMRQHLNPNIKDLSGNPVDEDYLKKLTPLVSAAADASEMFLEDDLEAFAAKQRQAATS